MSAGNLYRYFPSKEAIVEALCALDQEGRPARSQNCWRRTATSRAPSTRALRDHVLAQAARKRRA